MKEAIDLLEEATHRLRRLPASCFAVYYAGTLPFLLALLWFWAIMSRSARAGSQLGSTALCVAIAWLWMQTTKSLFAQEVLSVLRAEPAPRWTASAVGKVALWTAIVDAPSLFAVPIAAALVAPVGWVLAFYGHALVTRDPGRPNVWATVRDAADHARRRPGENHATLGLLAVVALIVFANVMALLWFLPELFHMLTGLESDIVLSGYSPVNTTVLAVAAAVTYALVDPLARVAYVLRSFHAEAERSGRDLLVDLRRAAQRRSAGSPGAVVIALALLVATSRPAFAETRAEPGTPAATGSATAPPGVDARELRMAIDRVLGRPEFAFRLPRADTRVPHEHGWVHDVRKWILDRLHDLGGWIRRAVRWLFGLGDDDGPAPSSPHGSSLERLATPALSVLAILSLALAAGAALGRVRRRPGSTTAVASVATSEPNLEDPALSPDRLPADEWARLAQRLWEAGERRLALRASFLELLALLSQAGILVPRPSKSIGDYEREIEQRREALPRLPEPFAENARIYEGAWYGAEPVTEEVLGRFLANAERIRSGAAG